MISKGQIKFIRLLHDKKYRLEEKRFLVEGEKLLLELLADTPFTIDTLFLTETFIQAHKALLSKFSSDIIHSINDKELNQISLLQSPNSGLAVVHFREMVTPKIDINKKYILLDNIKDPGNLGTIIRTADWFGIDTIFCSEACVEHTNPKVIQATMGSFFRMPIHYANLEELLKTNSSMPSYAATLEGENIFQTSLQGGGFLVIGSESHGISAALKTCISKEIMIPKIGAAESLNASIATAIICSEWTRQTKFA